MKKTFGLRSEIVISSSLLVGAALLFVALLLLRLSETRLLEQSIILHSNNAESLATLLVQRSEDELPQLLRMYARANHLAGWRLNDNKGRLIGGDSKLTDQLDAMQNRRTLLWQPLLIQLHYPPTWKWIVGDDKLHHYVDLTLPIHGRQSRRFTLQLRYSLCGIYTEMRALQQIAIISCLAYGLILVLTAVFLLNRSVVLPILQLTDRTTKLSHGDLAQRVEPTGPREIHTLGQSFNMMAGNLQHSAQQQQQHLDELQQANQQLQLAHQHLAQSERMASVGNLTSGIAHELGNPLSAVIGYLELLKLQHLDEQQQDLVGRALIESGRMDQLVKDLLDFAGAGQVTSGCICNLQQIALQTCDMLHNQGALKHHKVECCIPPDLSTTAIDASKFQQILVNLLINARDATAQNGSIDISGDKLDDGNSNTEWIKISVSDSGHGISKEQHQAIFDPFFTTKAPGKGRGLGLYVCYQLVNSCGGRITVESTPQQGSCFTVELPVKLSVKPAEETPPS